MILSWAAGCLLGLAGLLGLAPPGPCVTGGAMLGLVAMGIARRKMEDFVTVVRPGVGWLPVRVRADGQMLQERRWPLATIEEAEREGRIMADRLGLRYKGVR